MAKTKTVSDAMYAMKRRWSIGTVLIGTEFKGKPNESTDLIKLIDIDKYTGKVMAIWKKPNAKYFNHVPVSTTFTCRSWKIEEKETELSFKERALFPTITPQQVARSLANRMNRGNTEVETLKINDWCKLGIVLIGTELNELGYHRTEKIMITGIGQEVFLCRWWNEKENKWGQESGNTTLSIRPWDFHRLSILFFEKNLQVGDRLIDKNKSEYIYRGMSDNGTAVLENITRHVLSYATDDDCEWLQFRKL